MFCLIVFIINDLNVVCMKTTVSINIGGLAFHIDDDAYDTLKRYFKRVENQYAKEDGIEEIISDIESRIADLFKERVNDHKQVVVMQDVVDVIGIMGDPADFEDEKSDARTSVLHPRKNRIYRDVDHKILAGVCSGLAAYWSIDVIIIRVLFVVFAFGGGASLIIYLILWIVLPPALTTAEKIEMRGKPVNIDSIKDAVKEGFSSVKDSFKK